MNDEKTMLYVNGVDELSRVASKIDTIPPGENDVNMYSIICNKLKDTDDYSEVVFIEIVTGFDPDIFYKNDLVQKFIISISLLTYLYKLKATNQEVSICGMVLLLPYYMDNEDWLKTVITGLIPILVNNKILHKGRNNE